MKLRVSILLVAVVALLAVAPPAHGAATRSCKAGDLHYPFQPGGPKTFGVFKLTVTGGSCAKAHRVARSWMAEFELNLLLGKVKLPRKVAGFSFKSLPAGRRADVPRARAPGSDHDPLRLPRPERLTPSVRG